MHKEGGRNGRKDGRVKKKEWKSKEGRIEEKRKKNGRGNSKE